MDAIMVIEKCFVAQHPLRIGDVLNIGDQVSPDNAALLVRLGRAEYFEKPESRHVGKRRPAKQEAQNKWPHTSNPK